MSASSAAAGRQATERRQARASDPEASAWVSANAGTGKTYVLARRVLRLLLAGRAPDGTPTGTPPERILCLTFTKAAAAEMSSRVLAELARWVTLPEAELAASLERLLERPAGAEDRLRARRLFARALETPGGLKIETIHGFAERLLQRFPLEAGVAPGFAILDEAGQAQVLAEAIASVLASATGPAADPTLAAALGRLIAYAVEDGFNDIVTEARKALAASGGDADAMDETALRQALGVRSASTPETLAQELADTVSADLLPILAEALRAGTKSDVDNAMLLAEAAAAGSVARRSTLLEQYFLTKDGEPRKRLLTASVKKQRPDLEGRVERAQARFVELKAEMLALTAVEASAALGVLARAVEERYAAGKAQHAALDFSDLIEAAGRLLSGASEAQWVLYKLDGGLDHILVDEAQDTSRIQWQIVERLAEEFHAGASDRGPRTLFAVGDEKQSIYRFQGAAPELFAEMGRRFEARAQAAGSRFERVPLERSFRSTPAVLQAVDAVFNGPGAPRGLTAAEDVVRHEADRIAEGGLVEIWEPERPEAGADEETWSPGETTGPRRPEARLAERIAATIRIWLDRGEVLPSAGRPVRPGDILILVRKRRPLADQLIRALKAKGVAVGGADRLRLAEEIVVMDLLALGDVLLLPEDDLALAAVLKSPLYGLDDDDLFSLAAARRGSLWSALLRAAETEPRYRPAAEELKRLRARADFLPPFELYASLLDHDHAARGGLPSGRARLLARLGAEALDPLEELLARALHYDETHVPSLQGFLDWLRSDAAEVKRDMEKAEAEGEGAVRVMTVHGAKGLEAPIVFLADTCSTRSGGIGARLQWIDGGQARHLVWPVKGTSGLEPIRAARTREQAAERSEYYRLLYVAMTRARDRLYVTGFENARGRDQGCWWDVIHDQLAPSMTVHSEPDGQQRWRLEQIGERAVGEKPRPRPARPPSLPAWVARRAPPEPHRSIPIAPSRLAPLSLEAQAEDLGGEAPSSAQVPIPPTDRAARDEPPPATEPGAFGLPAPAAMSPAKADETARFRRGELSHALLEHLPRLPPHGRSQAASLLIERLAPDLAPRLHRSILTEVLAVLEHPAFAPLFGPEAQAEVAIAAEIEDPEGGAPLRVTGQIDRLLIAPREVLIVDYKSNRLPPAEPSDVPEAYLLQLAAYRLAIGRIYAGRTVRAALLWTDGARIMEIPDDMLDAAEARLWTVPRPNGAA